MNAATVQTLQPGEFVYMWHDAGCMGSQPVVLKVRKVNRKSLTVEARNGRRFQKAHHLVEGRWTSPIDTSVWDDPTDFRD